MKKHRKHIVVCAALILCSVALEYIVYLHYDSLTGNPVILNARMAVAPVYNTDGSWLHGVWGIGYNGALLCLENVAALLVAWYLFRFMEMYSTFFGLSKNWLYVIDLEIAVPIYRLLARLYRTYTLDYLYIRGYGTFDFPDFCIGAGIAGVVLWMLPAAFTYRRYKKKQTAGMRFLEKLKWEFRMSGRILYMPFVRKCRWEERFKKWR